MAVLIKILIEPMSFVYSNLPRFIQVAIANFIGILWFDVARLRRQVVLDNLSIAFPNWSMQQKIRVGRKSVQNLCLSLLETLIVYRFRTEWISKYTEKENFEIITKQLKNGKGALALGLHVGSIDLALTGIIDSGFKIYITTKTFSNKALNNIFLKIRQKTQAGVIADRRNPFEIFRMLKDNHVIGIIMDQYMGKPHGIESTFFSHPAGTAAGLAAFSIKTGLPVIPFYNFRRGDGKIVLKAEEPIYFEDCGNHEENIKILTQKYNDKIEEIVRKYPEQWMWVHKRWKKFV